LNRKIQFLVSRNFSASQHGNFLNGEIIFYKQHWHSPTLIRTLDCSVHAHAFEMRTTRIDFAERTRPIESNISEEKPHFSLGKMPFLL